MLAGSQDDAGWMWHLATPSRQLFNSVFLSRNFLQSLMLWIAQVRIAVLRVGMLLDGF
jgi:hypothetical protein